MKKISFLNAALILGTVVSVVTLTSCSPASEEVLNQSSPTAPVRIQITDFSISMDDINETPTRAAVSPDGVVGALTLAFYAYDGTKMYEATQLKSDASTFTNFGEFSLLLPVGNYTMVVIGRGVGTGDEFSVTSPTVAEYSSERARETFCKTQEVTVTSSTPLNLSVTLSRIIANLFVYSTDVRPAEASKIRTTYSAGSKRFNPTTGLATENTGFSLINNPSTAVGKTISVMSFVFLATDEQTMTITLDVLDDDDNVLITKEIPNVSLKRNRKTILRGPVFTPSASSASFLIETSWLDDHTITF
jgi:hypothetical protein